MTRTDPATAGATTRTPARRRSGGPSASRGRTWRPAFTRTVMFYRVMVFVIFALVWEVFARIVDGVTIPTFTGAVAGFVELLFDPDMWRALMETNISMLAGYVISLALGIPLGLAIGRARSLERYADVYLSILIVTPMAALFPLMIIAFGIGRESSILTVVIFAIPYVIVNARAGIRQVEPSIIEMGRCFGASETRIWTTILLPAATSAIMTGARVALGRGFTGIIVVELLLIPVGIGGLIIYYSGRFQPELMYGAIIIVVLEALVLFSSAQWIEKRLTRWRSAQNTDTQA
jgi:ABC-type nitrate/sulfonate/bicarbonate transport system permease component